MTMKLIAIFLLLFLSCHQFMLQEPQETQKAQKAEETQQAKDDQEPQRDSLPQATNFTGNFSSGMLDTISRVIHDSTARYGIKEYDKMAKYIGDALDQAYGLSWQIYLSHSDDCVMKSSNNHYGRNLAWKDTGLYHLCYIIFQVTCKVKMTRTQHQQMINSVEYWGTSFNESARQKIRALVKDATIYQGSNLSNNAVYINEKLGFGNWQTVIMSTAADSNFGYYFCILDEYWVELISYERFNWTYSISRYH